MKIRYPGFAFLFLVILFIGCKEHSQTAQPENATNQPQPPSNKPPAIPLSDKDPTFIESQTITSSHGPRNITRSILQDKSGNIWLASWEGIICYDGKSFTNFTIKEGLRRFHIFSMLEDNAGNLWFGTIGAGAYRYDGRSFTNLTTQDGLAGNRVNSIMEDKSGNIWFGTDGGASCYDGNSFRNFSTKEGLIHNDVYALLEDKTGQIWFGTNSGITCFDGQSMLKFNKPDGTPFFNVRSMIADKAGNIWIGGDGFWRFDGRNFSDFNQAFVGWIMEDKKGNLWISAGEPKTQTMVLCRYDAKTLLNGQTTCTKITKGLRQVFGLEEDSKGHIWFGTEQGVGRYDGRSFQYFKD